MVADLGELAQHGVCMSSRALPVTPEHALLAVNPSLSAARLGMRAGNPHGSSACRASLPAVLHHAVLHTSPSRRRSARQSTRAGSETAMLHSHVVYRPGLRQDALAGDQHGNIRVWDLTANACSCELVPEVGTAVRSLTVALDGSLVVAANNAGAPWHPPRRLHMVTCWQRTSACAGSGIAEH